MKRELKTTKHVQLILIECHPWTNYYILKLKRIEKLLFWVQFYATVNKHVSENKAEKLKIYVERERVECLTAKRFFSLGFFKCSLGSTVSFKLEHQSEKTSSYYKLWRVRVVLTTHRLAYLCCQCDACLDMKLALVW